ncbi:hypothetical protein SDC9_17672 [bioreactor metagenome]|uniref:J domain-containing protein n=1 Tax=bioreactor metagenome TaxID=1076179 RepID=A0A644TY51_9ZZZZ|nr:hypothetical protein [Lentimicrobium sp.]MEA5111690.1 hypothetical protein [Lentimicrobium sp.]
MQYFTITPETTPESLRAQYYELAKAIHPDTGGTKEEFQELQRQYKEALLSLSERPGYGYITESETFRKLMAAADDLLIRFDYPALAEIITNKAGELIDDLELYLDRSGLPESLKNLLKELKPVAKMTVAEKLSNPQQFALEVEKFIRNTKNRKKE